MIKEIGLGENGFTTNFPDSSFEDFKNALPRLVEISKGIDLPEEYVPQTIYWMFVNDHPVAYGKLFLKELKNAAKLKGIDQLLITCDDTNSRSRAVVESNHGVLEEIK